MNSLKALFPHHFMRHVSGQNTKTRKTITKTFIIKCFIRHSFKAKATNFAKDSIHQVVYDRTLQWRVS